MRITVLFLALLLVFCSLNSAHGFSQEKSDYKMLIYYYKLGSFHLFLDGYDKYREKYPESPYMPYLQTLIKEIVGEDAQPSEETAIQTEKVHFPNIKTIKKPDKDKANKELAKKFYELFSEDARLFVGPEFAKSVMKSYNQEGVAFLLYQSGDSMIMFDLDKGFGFMIPRNKVLIIEGSEQP